MMAAALQMIALLAAASGMAASQAMAAHGIEAQEMTRPGLGHGIDPDALSGAIEFLAGHLPS